MGVSWSFVFLASLGFFFRRRRLHEMDRGTLESARRDSIVISLTCNNHCGGSKRADVRGYGDSTSFARRVLLTVHM